MAGSTDDAGAADGDERPKLGSVVRRSDLYFHPPRYRDHRWLETNWFTWLLPERAMRGHLRSAFRTNLDVVETLVFVFDDPEPAQGILGLRYLDHRSHVPMPVTNLDHYRLESGVEVRMVEPMKRWQLRYEGSADTRWDLEVEAMMPPVLTSETGTEESARATIRHSHIDQMMRVRGDVRVRGEDLRVDFASPRDHSWSPRPESTSGYGYPMCGNFDWGSFGPAGQDFTFFVQTRNEWSDLRRGRVHNGFLLEGGELLRLRAGEGRYRYAVDDWWITGLEYELEDERGRTHRFSGTPKSFYRPGTGTLAVVEWRSAGGEVGWGEYNWHGDLYELQRIGRPPG